MCVLSQFFFKIIVPMVSLLFFAFAFAKAGIGLTKAWKEQNFKQIWLYIWMILFGLYLLIQGVKV